MNNELVWFLLPVGGLLRMISGTWNKAVDKYLTPLLITFTCYLYLGLSFWLLLVLGAYFIPKLLPTTLIGDSIQGNSVNWIWVWALGLINGLVSLSIGIWTSQIPESLWASLIPMFSFGIFITLSNLKQTRNIIRWKLVEFIMGVTSVIPVALLLQ